MCLDLGWIISELLLPSLKSNNRKFVDQWNVACSLTLTPIKLWVLTVLHTKWYSHPCHARIIWKNSSFHHCSNPHGYSRLDMVNRKSIILSYKLVPIVCTSVFSMKTKFSFTFFFIFFIFESCHAVKLNTWKVLVMVSDQISEICLPVSGSVCKPM